LRWVCGTTSGFGGMLSSVPCCQIIAAVMAMAINTIHFLLLRRMGIPPWARYAPRGGKHNQISFLKYFKIISLDESKF
jgi:hypothetical protein